MSVEAILVTVWALGWIAATLFAAVVIGNVENHPGDEAKSFPAFIFPLFFGWSWPLVLAIGLIVAPLSALSDRATARKATTANAVGTSASECTQPSNKGLRP